MEKAKIQEILTILERDSRTSPRKVAQMIGEGEQEVAQAISWLEGEGVLRRYKAIVDWERAGVEKVYAFIEVKVTPQRGVGFDAIAERIYRFPEVHSLYLMSGAYDLHVVVEGANMKEIAYFVAEKLAPLDHVQSTATHFVLKKYKVDGDILEGREEVERLSVSP